MIHTPRLTLRPATSDLLRAALDGPSALGKALGAVIPDDWPPEYLDEAALRYTMDRLAERPADDGWWMYFVMRRDDGREPTLIGSGGYKGPPDGNGEVEIGYGIVAGERRRGYGSEVARALVHHALAQPGTREVIAETLPELVGSIGVLERCGFRFAGRGSEPGVIRYRLAYPGQESGVRS
jgi:RimJ/RimL family protein N-acetyltransferase